MPNSSEDTQHLERALHLAAEHAKAGHGGPFGAVIVANGNLISEGWNQVTTTNDPTAHAEIVSIRAACRKLQQFHLPGAILYSTCEPCPMCLAASYWARLERIVFAAERSDAAAIGFDDDFLYKEIPLPGDSRRLPMTQLLRPEAIEMMKAWHADPNRTPY